MKFLCVPCDSPMKLQTLGPPEGGSLSVVYSCPECGYEMAMLTNPFETQLVQSLGVRIGPDMRGGASNAARASGAAPGADASFPAKDDDNAGQVATTSGPRCPFPAMMSAAEGVVESGGTVQAGEPIPVRWTSGAEARLANIPGFVRPMARTGIERFARERGSLEVDEKMLDAARDFFGM
jgi:hypothetical protein